VDADTFVK